MRGVLVTGVAAAVLAAGLPPAQAGPWSAIVMTASGGRQDGSFRYATTHGGDGRTCWTMHADGTGEQPAAVAHDGSALRWRLADKRKPSAVSLWFTRLGVPGAAPEQVRPTVTPVKSGKRVVAWTVTSPDIGYGDLDIALSVSWQGRCGADEASQRFHARSLPVALP